MGLKYSKVIILPMLTLVLSVEDARQNVQMVLKVRRRERGRRPKLELWLV